LPRRFRLDNQYQQNACATVQSLWFERKIRNMPFWGGYTYLFFKENFTHHFPLMSFPSCIYAIKNCSPANLRCVFLLILSLRCGLGIVRLLQPALTLAVHGGKSVSWTHDCKNEFFSGITLFLFSRILIFYRYVKLVSLAVHGNLTTIPMFSPQPRTKYVVSTACFMYYTLHIPW
jgi:hypothetical protein